MTTQMFPNTDTFPEESDLSFWREHLLFISGGENTRGMEIMLLTKMVSSSIEACFSQIGSSFEITPARWGILMWLLDEEKKGNCEGCTPTHMSQTRNVKKNTISSLLHGMEDQGLIERKNDPGDRRIFRIRLTEKGRQLAEEIRPKYVKMLNQLTDRLDGEEQTQLIKLMEKLILSMVQNGNLDRLHVPMERLIRTMKP